MLTNCPECARLWEAYLEARGEHAAARRNLETSVEKANIGRFEAASDAMRQLRTQLAGHQAASHGSQENRPPLTLACKPPA